MKICFIGFGFTPVRTSGLDVSAERLVAALLQAGHEVTVIAGSRQPQPETLRHPALTIHRLAIGPTNWIGYAYGAAQLLRRLNNSARFDIVHVWDVHFAYAFSTPYVATLHQSFRQRWRAAQLERKNPTLVSRWTYYALGRILAEQRSLRRADGLLAVSAATRAEFVRNYAVSPNRVALARHGIDSHFFAPRPNTVQLRARYGLAPAEPVVLFVGFVTRRKGLEYMAQALQLVHPPMRVVVAGRWSAPTRSRFIELLGTAADRLIEAGFVADEEMPNLYSLADVYVSSSLLEGFGLPLAEALACGTPVVAAEAGSVAEVVGPGGILVPPRDPVALAAAISRLVADPSLAESLGRLGRAHIVAEFSLERMRDDTLAAYRRFGASEAGPIVRA